MSGGGCGGASLAGRRRSLAARDAGFFFFFATSIWKQCNVAQSGSGEGTNVCLMWDCPGRCNCCLYKEERDGEEGIKNVIKRDRQLVEAVRLFCFSFFFSR